MDERDLLANSFEAHRAHLRAVAYRMLGSEPEANDAVQEAWLRVSRAGDTDVDNIGGWLTTIVSRVCLDQLRTRRARGEEALGAHEPQPEPRREHERSPEERVQLADAVGMAMLVVLEALEPAERVAFVLHDMFDLTFDEIAPIVDRSAVATRQLASRARRRVRGAPAPAASRDRHREIVEAFIAASKAGDLEALVAILDPDIVARTDAQGVRMGGQAEVRGAANVAAFFKGRARAAVAGLVDGGVGIIVPLHGRILLAFDLRFRDGRIAAMDVVADPEALAVLDLKTMAGGDPLSA